RDRPPDPRGLRSRGRQRTTRRRLFADRAASRRPHGRRARAEAGLRQWRGHPRAHRRRDVRRSHPRHARERQDDQLRDPLRHQPLGPRRAAQGRGGRGAGDDRHLFQALPRHPALHHGDARDRARARLFGDAVRPQDLVPADRLEEPDRAPGQRAGGDQRADPGDQRRHHQARDGPDDARARRRRSGACAHAAAGARRTGVRTARRRRRRGIARDRAGHGRSRRARRGARRTARDRDRHRRELGDGPLIRPRLRPRLRRRHFGNLAVLGLIAFALFAGLFLVFQTIEAERAERQQVQRTSEILMELRNINRAALNAETGQRGYLLTLDRRYLEPYLVGREQYGPTLDRLRELVGPDATARQLELLDEIESLTESKFAEMAETVALVEQRQVIEARRGILDDRGAEVMARLRRATREMEQIENRILIRAASETARAEGRVLPLLGAVLLMLLVALVLGYVLVTRAARAEAEAAQAAALGEARDRADLLARELN